MTMNNTELIKMFSELRNDDKSTKLIEVLSGLICTDKHPQPYTRNCFAIITDGSMTVEVMGWNIRPNAGKKPEPQEQAALDMINRLFGLCVSTDFEVPHINDHSPQFIDTGLAVYDSRHLKALEELSKHRSLRFYKAPVRALDWHTESFNLLFTGCDVRGVITACKP